MAKKKKKMHRIGTGNEKWKHYDNPKCRKLWGKLSDASTLSIKLKNHSSKLLLKEWADSWKLEKTCFSSYNLNAERWENIMAIDGQYLQ